MDQATSGRHPFAPKKPLRLVRRTIDGNGPFANTVADKKENTKSPEPTWSGLLLSGRYWT